ncbi:11-beta-hydroxysteroid dehydrogenase-like 6 [Hibiscus syriacus]|uniref:11-beta-hydroxysteroid dehydrogenase-like 6 n=1 Tax=Hibiscus syriacus TaxID=106335 RepID=UPI0019205285|nr:11-beta-hydroxysteroid dehydrogenase-like 6 [Hibiscus syriacus]
MNKFVNGVVSITSLLTILVFFLPYRLLMSLVSSAKALLEENVRGRVILITGASSGVGEHVAYEYARRGARLALVARRQGQLQQVGDVCEMSGSPEAVCIVGDVANIQDCKRFVDATVTHFGQLDHLVTNAGVTPLCLFEDYDDITKASPAMVITHQTNELTSFLK